MALNDDSNIVLLCKLKCSNSLNIIESCCRLSVRSCLRTNYIHTIVNIINNLIEFFIYE